MYIPRPAKLLFQHDDGWSRYLEKHGDTLSDWTKAAQAPENQPGGNAAALRQPYSGTAF